MNIDFHYGMIYVVSRLAGLGPDDAETVAHACQYVDDASTDGVLLFKGGETFERFASAHTMLDYKNKVDHSDRLVWAPFHFLPGNEGATFEERVICRPNSEIAREMVRRFLEMGRKDPNGRDRDNALHQLGILLHTYVDTWAHHGFSGIISESNSIEHLVGDDHDHSTWLGKLAGHLQVAVEELESAAAQRVAKVGHGAALHFPDLPWAKWTYTNGLGEEISRDNLPEFVEAANMAFKVVSAYRQGRSDFAALPDLGADDRLMIEAVLNESRSHHEAERLETIFERLGGGKLAAMPEPIPTYVPKGSGSWKHAATGLETTDDGQEPPDWTLEFEDSDYRKFHDAVKTHRMDVLQYLLPDFGIRLA